MNEKTRGKHIVVEGQDGSGKSTIVQGVEKQLKQQGKQVLNLKEYSQTHQAQGSSGFPSLQELSQYDVVVIAEPTHSTTGRYIRDVLINKDKPHSEEEIAKAFAEDRLQLFKEVVLPALEHGIHFIQDRSVISTICYQILANPEQTDIFEAEHPYVLLEGNQLEIQQTPDLIIVPFLNAETGMARTKQRDNEDDAKYENVEFQKKLASFYGDEKIYQQIYDRQDLNIIFINTGEYNETEAIQQATETVLHCLEKKLTQNQ